MKSRRAFLTLAVTVVFSAFAAFQSWADIVFVDITSSWTAADFTVTSLAVPADPLRDGKVFGVAPSSGTTTVHLRVDTTGYVFYSASTYGLSHDWYGYMTVELVGGTHTYGSVTAPPGGGPATWSTSGILDGPEGLVGPNGTKAALWTDADIRTSNPSRASFRMFGNFTGTTAPNADIFVGSRTITTIGPQFLMWEYILPDLNGEEIRLDSYTVDVGAPVALNDTATVPEDSISALISVLANDTDSDGDPLSVTAVGLASHGTVSVVSGQARYTPTANYNGPDSFSYTVGDGTGRSDTATASITVSSVADAPNAPSTLLTDSAVNPNNVSRYVPTFSWTFSDIDQADASGDWQTAYQVRIGTTPGSSSTWDSGKLLTLASNGPYGGVELTPNTTYYWSVRVWDTSNVMGSYSADGTFVVLDIGLRVFDGTWVIRVATDYAGPAHKLRISKSGTTYGIILVDPSDPEASKIRIQTPSGIKALKKMM